MDRAGTSSKKFGFKSGGTINIMLKQGKVPTLKEDSALSLVALPLMTASVTLPHKATISRCAEEIYTIWETSKAQEWIDVVDWIPFWRS